MIKEKEKAQSATTFEETGGKSTSITTYLPLEMEANPHKKVEWI